MNHIRPASWPKSGWYWHLHHDQLIEWIDDIDERWDYVIRVKAPEELETRLHLMGPVIGPVPARLDEARTGLYKVHAKLGKARARWGKAHIEWGTAVDEWNEAVADPAVIALHAKECPGCPWDGRTIFPGGTP